MDLEHGRCLLGKLRNFLLLISIVQNQIKLI
jgi:hypothetical protein